MTQQENDLPDFKAMHDRIMALDHQAMRHCLAYCSGLVPAAVQDSLDWWDRQVRLGHKSLVGDADSPF